MIRRLGLTSPITWFSPDSYRGEAKNETESLSQKYASSALFRIPRKSTKRPSIRREMQALLLIFYGILNSPLRRPAFLWGQRNLPLR